MEARSIVDLSHSQGIALSLFSGSGGMDIGVSDVGYEILASVEIDPYCCETLRTNIRRENRTTEVIEDDVRAIDPWGLMRRLDVVPGELDLLFGGPPCQSFSQIGKQLSLEDERGLLLFQMIRFAKVFQPKVVMIEQVKGLLSSKDKLGNRGGVLQILLNDLELLGYVPKWQVINAADYGVPQLRRRVFVVATQQQYDFRFPEPSHSPNGDTQSLFPITPYMTVGDAIKGLGTPTPKTEGSRSDSHVDVTPKGDRARIHGVPEGSYLAAQLHLPDQQRGRLTKKDTTKFLRVSRSQPANTIGGGEIFFHPLQDRYLTPRESMRIQGFPDAYMMTGPIRSRSGRVKYLDQHRQIANAVAPPVARRIAQEIAGAINCLKYSKYLVTP